MAALSVWVPEWTWWAEYTSHPQWTWTVSEKQTFVLLTCRRLGSCLLLKYNPAHSDWHNDDREPFFRNLLNIAFQLYMLIELIICEGRNLLFSFCLNWILPCSIFPHWTQSHSLELHDSILEIEASPTPEPLVPRIISPFLQPLYLWCRE